MSPESDLKSLLQSATNAQVSLALYDLATDTQLMVQPDVPFHPASTFKLGVMMEVFHQEAQGLLSLDELLPVKNAFLKKMIRTKSSTSTSGNACPCAS
jgi:beta-lactamase class A